MIYGNISEVALRVDVILLVMSLCRILSAQISGIKRSRGEFMACHDFIAMYPLPYIPLMSRDAYNKKNVEQW